VKLIISLDLLFLLGQAKRKELKYKYFITWEVSQHIKIISFRYFAFSSQLQKWIFKIKVTKRKPLY